MVDFAEIMRKANAGSGSNGSGGSTSSSSSSGSSGGATSGNDNNNVVTDDKPANSTFASGTTTTSTTTTTASASGNSENNENLAREKASEEKKQEVSADKQHTPEEMLRQSIEKLLAMIPNLDHNTKQHAHALGASAAAGLSGPAAENALRGAVANAAGISHEELKSREAVHDMKESLKGTFSIASALNLNGSAYNSLAANVSANQNAGKEKETSLGALS